MKFFVTGTDTDIGKTVIASWLALHLNAYYWKPISSSDGNHDHEIVKKLAKIPDNKIIDSNYKFKTPVSPHLAAKIENNLIDFTKFHLPQKDHLIVEGAGGVLVPINDKYLIIDLIKKLNIPVIIVARSSIGTINHTCLTIEALRSKKIPIFGIIMNGKQNTENRKAIEKYGKVKVLSEFSFLSDLNHKSLKEIPLFDIGINNLTQGKKNEHRFIES